MKNTLNKVLGTVLTVGLLGVGSAASADILRLPMLTDDPRPASQVPPTFTGKYGWDWDEAPPVASGAAGGAPGFGNSAWYSNVQGSASGSGRPYTTLRLFPENMFSMPITVGEVEDITYWTNYESGVDWVVRIYTKPTSTNWYDSRVRVNNPTLSADGAWDMHSASALGVAEIRDANPLPAVTTNNQSWADMIAAIGSEEIMFVDFSASYASNSPPSYSYLDGITISLANNAGSLSLDLEVPAPGVLSLTALGLIGVGWRRRRALQAH